MKKLSIITISLLAAFNASANNEKTNEIYNEIVSGINSTSNIISTESSDSEYASNAEEKSKYRRWKELETIKKEYLDEKNEVLEKEQQQRVLKYKLSLPVERTIDDEKLLMPSEDEFNPEVRIGPELPVLEDQSVYFNNFKPETYEIDQLIIKEREQRETEVLDNDEDTQDQDIKIVQEQIKVKESETENDTNDSLLNNGSQKIENEISDDELKLLGWTREEYDKFMGEIKTKTPDNIFETPPEEAPLSDVKKEKKIEFVQYAEIKNVSIKKILIYDGIKTIDISLDIYVGDGSNGKTHKKVLKDISEGSIFAFKGFKFKINAITNDEVEIEDLSNKKIYLSSTTLSTM